MSRFGKDVETKWGLYIDDNLEDKVKFTILATGFGIKDVPGMNNKLSAEEQKRQEELEEEEQKKAERVMISIREVIKTTGRKETTKSISSHKKIWTMMISSAW